MSKKWDGMIPFDSRGNLIDYVGPYNIQNVNWQPNFTFMGYMRIETYYQGRSSAGFILSHPTQGTRFPISLNDFFSVIDKVGYGHIAMRNPIKWTFAKKGRNFFIVPKL